MISTKCLRSALLAAAVTLLSGCGSHGATQQQTISGSTLTVYVSVPLNGASAISGRAVVDGADLALDGIHARIGRYRIVLRELDDATPQRGAWDPGQTTLNVRQAVLDKTTIGYIGEFNSGASAVSIPLLNRAGIPQISPSATAVGLTDGGPAASPGEPQKYYPTGVRTFARVVPNDSVQAAVQAKIQKAAGCRRSYVLDDGEVDGRDAAESFEVAAKSAGLDVVGTQEFEARATDYTSLARSLVPTGADCVLVSAITDSHAVLVVKQVAAALPAAMIFGSAGLAESTFTDPNLGGIPIALDPRVTITVATLDPSAYPPAGRRFFELYAHRYGSAQPYAIYGYAAMSLMLDAVARATDHGSEPAALSKVRAAIFATHDRPSVLGQYSVDSQGDTSIDRYGVYRLRDGRLSYWKAMQG
ncbi:MAG TPA: branched-chain amino acid ABC transporter substrate-binding protein [Solirubrobacteraceae bacterium]